MTPHRRVPEIARDDDVVIIDTPQIEDHAGIARSALRYADETVIPCAPNPIEGTRGQRESMLLSRQPRACKISVLCIDLWMV